MCIYVTNKYRFLYYNSSMNRININKHKTQEILELMGTLRLKEICEFELELNKNLFNKYGIKSFVDLAQIYFLKLIDISYESDNVVIVFTKLNEEKSFHKELDSNEKYGTKSEFFTINKINEFSFLYYYQEALKFIGIDSKTNILNIGVNKGDEFSVIKELLEEEKFRKKTFCGIDYSSSAIEFSKTQFSKYDNVDFICADINKLDSIGLGRFDLVISIGTLQSSNINFNSKFMEIYQNHLTKGGAIILGFPNCRWIDSEMVYGAKAPNYSFNEMSLVLKDIHFCKKYLQQKGYRVIVTGKDYLFLSARKII